MRAVCQMPFSEYREWENMVLIRDPNERGWCIQFSGPILDLANRIKEPATLIFELAAPCRRGGFPSLQEEDFQCFASERPSDEKPFGSISRKAQEQDQMERVLAEGDLERAIAIGENTEEPAALICLMQALTEEENWDGVHFFSEKMSSEMQKDWYVEIGDDEEPAIKLM